jgi:hypothetical protein
MPTALRDVRSQGQTGKHLLALSFSGFDPKPTSDCIRYCGSQNRPSHSNPQKRSIVLWYKVTERTVFVY